MTHYIYQQLLLIWNHEERKFNLGGSRIVNRLQSTQRAWANRDTLIV